MSFATLVLIILISGSLYIFYLCYKATCPSPKPYSRTVPATVKKQAPPAPIAPRAPVVPVTPSISEEIDYEAKYAAYLDYKNSQEAQGISGPIGSRGIQVDRETYIPTKKPLSLPQRKKLMGNKKIDNLKKY